MDDFTKRLRLRVDLDRQVVTIPQRGHLTYGDSAADMITAEVYRGNTQVMLDGVSAGAVFYAPPSRAEINLEATASGNTVSVVLNEHCYAEEGDYKLEIHLRDTGRRVTILSISGSIHRAGSGVIIDASGTIPSIDDLLDMIDDIGAAKQAAYDAAGAASAAAAALEGMRVYANTVSYETGAHVKVENQGGKYVLTFSIPRGAPGSISNVSVNSIHGLIDQLNMRPTKAQLVDLVYPVGSIYMSVSDVSPTVFLGGEWERLEDVFLLGSSEYYPAGTRGGAAEVSLTGEQNGPHTHGLKITKNKAASGSELSRIDTESSTPSGSLITESGEGAPHENMPPYLAVYMWQRTA